VTAALLLLLALALPQPAQGNPHLLPSFLPQGCKTCHAGHSAKALPLLASHPAVLCLDCHGSASALAARISNGDLAPTARPKSLEKALSAPYRHPMARVLGEEAAAPLCTDCHRVHGAKQQQQGNAQALAERPPERAWRSVADPEACVGCHGPGGKSRTNVAALLDGFATSAHPLLRFPAGASPSLQPGWQGKLLQCGDCHGNDDPEGPRGVHGSRVAGILRLPYSPHDAAADERQAAALCYSCHDREKLMSRSPFPLHRRHVLEGNVPCSGCHDPHGSRQNRALIRLGEQLQPWLAPSASGRLAFVSPAPGGGSCYVTCHGKNHDPSTYGSTPTPASLLPRLPEPAWGILPTPPRGPGKNSPSRPEEPRP